MGPEESTAGGTLNYSSLTAGRRVVVFTFIATALWYLSWRAGTLNEDAIILSLLVYGAEWYAFIVALLHIFISWRPTVREPPPAPDVTVAVFIPTINEPVSLVRRTVLAAVHMDYPHETWLLDDGNRPEMEALAKELGCNYLARRNNIDAKAGNLNHGLQHTKADFIAIFDADHCPHNNFLTRTLGYFRNPSVAFVQTPQDFYNLDSYQHRLDKQRRTVWNEQTLFFRLIQRGKDAWNAAIFCGSCAILRRSMLDEIGGFATGTVTEDIHTSLRLHKQGFESVYHAEPLAFGLAPADHRSFLIQRIRWGQGAMQVWRKERLIFSRNLTFAQRLSYLASITVFFEGWQRGFFYFLPAFVLVSGWMPVDTIGPDFLRHFIPYFVFSIWAYVEVSRGYGWPFVSEQYTMARYGAFIKSTLGLFKRNLRFAVTPKLFHGSSGSPSYFLPQYAVLWANLACILLVALFLFDIVDSTLPTSVLIACIVWATFNCIIASIVLRLFATSHEQHRTEYRHPIPAPVRLTVGTRHFFSTVDSLSSRGMRLLMAPYADIFNDEVTNGELYLPSGPLPFAARIVRLENVPSLPEGYEDCHAVENHACTVGCEFTSMSTEDQNRLNLFLYGTDTQMKVNNLRERKVTPVDWLDNYIHRHNKTWKEMPKHWLPVAYRSNRQAEALNIGLISADRRALLMPFRSPGIADPVQLQVLSHARNYPLFATLSTERRIESPGSPLYLYQLDSLN